MRYFAGQQMGVCREEDGERFEELKGVLEEVNISHALLHLPPESGRS